MRRCRLFSTVATLVAATAVRATTTPVPWTAAAAHVGSLVTIEGVVARAETTAERRCVLTFDPADPAALRVVLLIPLLTDLPSDPSRLYQGRRVRATGRVMRFQRRLEMVVTPPQLEVVGLTTSPPAATPEPSSRPPEPHVAPTEPPAPRSTPAPTSLPAATSAPAPITTVAPPAAPVAPVVAPDPRCRAWREERAATREELRALTRLFETCLAEGRTGCPALGDRLGPPLSRLEAVEQRLGLHCP